MFGAPWPPVTGGTRLAEGRDMRVLAAALLLLAFPACDAALVHDEELAAETQAVVDNIDGKTFLDYLENAAWKYTPLFKPTLEIHTCDNPSAETDDSVQFTIQTGNSVYSYWLSSPEDDFDRNHTASFVLPTIGGSTMQAGDIRLIRLFKTGGDAWCFDRLTLKSQGNTFWEWTASDTTVIAGNPLRPNTGTGAIWLNTAGDGAPSPDVVFADKTIKYKDKAKHGTVDLKIKTCDGLGSPLLDQVDARITWSHDGFVESKALKVNGNDDHWPPNHTETIRLHNSVAIEKLDWMKFQARDGNLCIAKIEVLINGQSVFADFPNASVGEMYDSDWKTYTNQTNLVVETGTKIGVLGRPIKNVYPAIVDYGWSLSGSPRTYCSLPGSVTRTDIRKMVETFFATQAHGKAYWGDGSVTVTRVDGNTLHVKLAFQANVEVGPAAHVWAEWDLDVGCKDTNTQDDDDTKRLVFTPTHFTKDYDVKPWQDALVWFGEKLNFIDVKALLDKYVQVPDEQIFDTGNACPTPSIDANGTIRLAWPTVPLVNMLCSVDGDHWDEMAAIARRDFDGP
jgi:hypothetical protein